LVLNDNIVQMIINCGTTYENPWQAAEKHLAYHCERPKGAKQPRFFHRKPEFATSLLLLAMTNIDFSHPASHLHGEGWRIDAVNLSNSKSSETEYS
jgi:hypothetical protein